MKFAAAAALLAAAVVSAEPVKHRATITAPEKRSTTYTGEGTIYTQGGVAGSCGVVHSDYDYICALGDAWMNYQYKAPYCGDTIHVENIGSNDGVGGAGNTVTVTVADTCAACDQTHLDFSVGAWNALTNSAAWGTIEIQWYFE